MTKLAIVAEVSANHLGSKARAHRIIDAAADAEATHVKFQTWSPGTMCLSDYRLDSGPWSGRLLRELYEEAHTPWSWHADLFDHARQRGLEPFSAAFDAESVDFLETLGVKRHKVASFELVDLPLIQYMAQKRQPMILSTGMATMHERFEALDACFSGNPFCDVIQLICTSAYPAHPRDANLAARMAATRGSKRGISDHTRGIGVSVAAVALGAVMVEKHLTLSRADGGLDASFSMEPEEFAQLVTECRHAAEAVEGRPGEPIGEDRTLRRSLWACADIQRGDQLTLGVNVRTARLAFGLPCGTNLYGKTASRRIHAGQPLTAECLA